MNFPKRLGALILLFSTSYCQAFTQKATPYIVATGAQGTIITSSDGQHWTTQPTNTTYTLNSVAYNGQGQLMAVGELGIVSTSLDDGLHWTTTQNPEDIYKNHTLNSVIFNGTNFALSQYLGTSDNHVSVKHIRNYWYDIGQEGTDFINNPTYGIAYDGNIHYVAVGTNGKIFTLNDIKYQFNNWTAQDSHTYNNLNHVIYDGKQYIAVGDKGTILTSPDSFTWTTRPNGRFNINYHSITFSNNLYVIVGDAATIITSPDGITWTSRNANISTSISLNGIDYNGKQFIAVGDNGTLLTSSDAITWTKQDSGTQANLYGVTARTLFAQSLCPNYFSTKWVGDQMPGGFNFSIGMEEDDHSIWSWVDYYDGRFGTSLKGTCVDNFSENSVTLTFTSNTSIHDSITVKAIGPHADKLTILSGQMENSSGSYSSISGELVRKE